MKEDFVKRYFVLIAVAAGLAMPAAVLAQEQTGASTQSAPAAKVKKGGGARPAPIRGTVREATSRPPLKLEPRGEPKR